MYNVKTCHFTSFIATATFHIRKRRNINYDARKIRKCRKKVSQMKRRSKSYRMFKILTSKMLMLKKKGITIINAVISNHVKLYMHFGCVERTNNILFLCSLIKQRLTDLSDSSHIRKLWKWVLFIIDSNGFLKGTS